MSDDSRDRDLRGPRGPATEAIERLAEAIEEQNRQRQIQNAILAVMAANQESQYRKQARNEEPTSYSYTWTRFGADVQDALLTLREVEDDE